MWVEVGSGGGKEVEGRKMREPLPLSLVQASHVLASVSGLAEPHAAQSAASPCVCFVHTRLPPIVIMQR